MRQRVDVMSLRCAADDRPRPCAVYGGLFGAKHLGTMMQSFAMMDW